MREPEVTGLSAERAMECLANLCHARHPGFAPKKKDGSGEAARPREGQSWSSGGQTGGGAGGVKPPKIDPTKTANEVLPGSLRREFPGQHLDKSLNQIKELLRTAHGEEKRSLQTAKKLLEQSERLLDKTRNK